MRTLTTSFLASLLVALLIAGCDSFVEDVDLPVDTIDNEQLTDESQVSFLISGLQTRFATTHDRLALLSDGLSDQLIFDQRVPNATFPTYQEVDIGEITLDNNSVDNPFTGLGELRFFSDEFLDRIAEIEFEDADLQREAQFTGTFYGGVARYFYATFFGLEPRMGGGVINAGPFIPSGEMYVQALDKLNASLGFADAYQASANCVFSRMNFSTVLLKSSSRMPIFSAKRSLQAPSTEAWRGISTPPSSGWSRAWAAGLSTPARSFRRGRCTSRRSTSSTLR